MGCMDSDPMTFPDIVKDVHDGPRVACVLSHILAKTDKELVKILRRSRIKWENHGISCEDAIAWLLDHRSFDRTHK